MKLRRLGAVALGFVLVSFAAPIAEGDPSRSAPMRFVLRQDQANCTPSCKTWVSATGMIRAETPREFETFAAKHNLRGATIVLNSEGGSVHGAIALGRAIRKLEMTTTVGRTVSKGSDQRVAAIVPRADCESMCAFVLLAGAKRIVPPEARVRVHQIWLGDRRDDAAAANYTAEDLVLVQRDIGKLAQYTVEMGGSVDLLELSLRIPPWEPMRVLTRDEMRRMNLDNSDVVEARGTTPEATTSSAPAQFPAKRISYSPRDRERGWFLADKGGAQVLRRRHPLTVEGEDVGSIDLTFACGNTAGEYLVLYSETRRSGDRAAVNPLKSVELRIANRVIPLTLGVSRTGQNPGEHLWTASGAVTGDMLETFASAGLRSMVVESTPENADPAVIRIGNTGVAANVTRLIESCSPSAPSDPAEHAELKPSTR